MTNHRYIFDMLAGCILVFLSFIWGCGDDSHSTQEFESQSPEGDSGVPSLYNSDVPPAYEQKSSSAESSDFDSAESSDFDSEESSDSEEASDAESDTDIVTEEPADCGDIPEGTQEERTMYKSVSVPYDSTCESEIQKRDCIKGAFTEWSGTFAADSCIMEDPANCDEAIHGAVEQRTRYENASKDYGEECVSEVQSRICTDGAWGSWSGSFDQESCYLGDPEDCGSDIQGQQQRGSWSSSFDQERCYLGDPEDCGSDIQGQQQKRTRYENRTVPLGQNCVSEEQIRTCIDDDWGDWSGTYTEDSCAADSAADCEGTAHGGQRERTRYENESVPYGSECVLEVQTSICDNGIWESWTGEFAYESCLIDPPASCDDTAHGEPEERIRFEEEIVDSDQQCNFEIQARTCDNGTWLDWEGNYIYESCSVEGFDNCDDWPHGFEQKRIRYQEDSALYNETCVSEEQTRACNDGEWTEWQGASGYTVETCKVEEPASCDGKPHGVQQQRERFEYGSVPYSESCVSEVQTRVCDNGEWTEWQGTYDFSEQYCEPADFDGSCYALWNDGFCTEYSGTGYTSSDVSASCLVYGLLYSSNRCPTNNRVAACTVRKGEPKQAIDFYSAPTYDVESAAEDCAQRGGIFTPYFD